MRTIGLGFILLLGLFTGACTQGGVTSYAVAPGQYRQAFEASRQVLRDERWLVERVDAAQGVLTTQRRADLPAGDAYGTLENVMNRQIRHVRITFVPADGASRPVPLPDPASPELSSTTPDLTEGDVPLVMRVRVLVERVQRPGQRPATNSIRLSSYAIDPELVARGQQPLHSEPAGEDQAMAAEIARAIAASAGLSAVARP